jgi:hypothetical protein
MAGQTGSSEQRCVLSTLGYQEYYWCGNSKDENGISWVARHGTQEGVLAGWGEGGRKKQRQQGDEEAEWWKTKVDEARGSEICWMREATPLMRPTPRWWH